MTKVTIIGEEPRVDKGKRIEFCFKLNPEKCSPSVENNILEPNRWENVELICKGFANSFDLMFAYDFKRSTGVLYLGHFNDGIV